jgi:hypothetical protein
VRWSTVAAWNGKTVHPEMQFHSIGGPWMGAPQLAGPRVYEPHNGVLSDRQCRALIELLVRHTETPDSCWLCLWDGYGDLHPGGSVHYLFAFTGKPPSAGIAPPRRIPPPPYSSRRVSLPAREYLLFKAPVTAAQGWRDGPNLWWPEDRSWCVASEIDFPYTYAGGSKELIGEILGHPDLEALPARLSDGITAIGDTINA